MKYQYKRSIDSNGQTTYTVKGYNSPCIIKTKQGYCTPDYYYSAIWRTLSAAKVAVEGGFIPSDLVNCPYDEEELDTTGLIEEMTHHA